jgi:hypothetical protein
VLLLLQLSSAFAKQQNHKLKTKKKNKRETKSHRQNRGPRNMEGGQRGVCLLWCSFSELRQFVSPCLMRGKVGEKLRRRIIWAKESWVIHKNGYG